MKRVIIFLSLLLYMMVSMGTIIQRHYCMGRFYTATILPQGRAACSKCGMAKGSAHQTGCCNSESKFVRMQVDQQATDHLVKGMYTIAVAGMVPSWVRTDLLSGSKRPKTISGSHPPGKTSSIFIIHCALLI